MGGKNKVDEVGELAEARGILMAGDAMSLEELEGFPDLSSLSDRNKGIMCMVACGFPVSHVASAFGISQPTCWETVKRIDPDGRFKLGKEAKRAFITQMAEGRAMSAISAISLEDIENSSAIEKARIADTFMKISQQINQTKHREISAGKLDRMLDVLDGDVGGPPYEEES